ncbi:hypothetical protein KP509_37G026500 [Ceratopteris richardii]|uniref:Uncharacterized protein n=1 Tax=Ceratopteris richardii TaxID=49495 RepID=A0A8T2Q6M3_CERRI|nr:hypothetical protein KP509_37G026500 [Ceratopteris richardii]
MELHHHLLIVQRLYTILINQRVLHHLLSMQRLHMCTAIGIMMNFTMKSILYVGVTLVMARIEDHDWNVLNMRQSMVLLSMHHHLVNVIMLGNTCSMMMMMIFLIMLICLVHIMDLLFINYKQRFLEILYLLV